jgi:biotin carboxyl carrier protein
MKLVFDYNSQSFPVDLTPSGKSYRATIGDRIVDVELIHVEKEKLDLLVNGKRIIAYISSDGVKRWVTVNSRTFVLTKPAAGARDHGHGGHHAAGELTAPMPGQVRAVNVSEGEAVTKGQTLLVLEAMKMEIRVQARRDGMVRKLLVRQGQTVEREQILIEIEESS